MEQHSLVPLAIPVFAMSQPWLVFERHPETRLDRSQPINAQRLFAGCSQRFEHAVAVLGVGVKNKLSCALGTVVRDVRPRPSPNRQLRRTGHH